MPPLPKKMAPVKHRFSMRAYAGKRQPKQSLNIIKEDDAFDNLLKNEISSSNIFESSSEKPCSSQSRVDSETSNVTKSDLNSTPGSNICTSQNKIRKIGVSRVKKKKKFTKAMYSKFLKDNMSTSQDLDVDKQFASSTPNLRSIRKYKEHSISFPVLGFGIVEDIGLSPNSICAKSIDALSRSLLITPIKSAPEGNSNISSRAPLKLGNLSHDIITNESSDESSIIDSSFKAQSNKQCETSHSMQEGKIIKAYTEFSDHEILETYLNNLVISESNHQGNDNEDEFSASSKEENCLHPTNSSYKSMAGKSNNRNGKVPDRGSSYVKDSVFQKMFSVCDDSIKGNLLGEENKSVSLKEESEFYSAEDSSRKSEEDSFEESFSKLSLTSEANQKGSWTSTNNINTRRRKNIASIHSLGSSTVSLNPFQTSQQDLSISDTSSNIDKKKLSQRLSRSLPASFKDKSPCFYSERFILSDTDLIRSRKSLSKLRDESLYSSLTCSTRSLPAVLEDQDRESKSDEELSTHRSSYHFRKASLDSSQGSHQFFLGFSNSDLSKSRRNFMKKFNSEELPCTSPHTLPALLEDESDSSCEEDESKKMESGSSSQVESPLMSPGIQGSPSRRGSARISTSNSSETSLSSRSEGIISPMQDDMGNMLSPRAGSPDVAAVSSEEDSGSSPVKRDEQRRRRPSRLTRRTLGYIAEETESDASEPANLPTIARERLVLMTGKKYRRSLAILHSLMEEETVINDEHKGRGYIQSVEAVKMLQRDDYFHGDSDDSLDMSPGSRRSFVKKIGVSRNKAHSYSTAVFCINSNPVDVSVACSRFSCLPSLDSSQVSRFSFLDSTQEEVNLTETLNKNLKETLSPTEAMILRISNQDRTLDLNNLYADNSLETWEKIGEGVYSEVFSLCRMDQPASVLKIIPVDGDVIVNGGAQKPLEENLSEVLITYFLSQLRNCSDNYCSGFVQLLRVWYLEGAYPEELIKLWNDFDIKNGSDNDRPTIFPTNQKYLGLELVNSGRALESYTFSSARQSIAIFKQIVFSLAVAETMYEFEHRDLHWGNILVDKTKDKAIDFIIDGDTYSVTTNGVRATIIDYTWSALTCRENNMRIVNDMEEDSDLFLGSGDFQFEVYRMMRQDVEQDWNKYQPKTNLRWLYYLADKLINRAKYLRPSANAHKTGIASLRKILDFIPHCDNSLQVAVELMNYK